MAVVIYILCALCALLCAFLLMRAYLRSKYRLLLWSSICFAGLTLNNSALILDKTVLVSIDLSLWRTSFALAAMVVLLYGLIWDSD
jgi:uncharacterized membrane protein YhfC